MESILRNFENIGNNCEFGFFLNSHGIQSGGLFRWAFVQDFEKLAEAIRNEMARSFVIDALAPFSQTMIVDNATAIAYHTKMRIHEDRGLQFSDSAEQRQVIYEEELHKFLYLRDKFFTGLRASEKIYVMKCNTGIPDTAVESVLSALQEKGAATVFHVRRAENGNTPGTVIRTGPSLLTGYIDRFADYRTADDFSKDCWAELCANAWKMMSSGSSIEIGVGDYQKNDTPITVPPDFNDRDYFLANPGVEESGMAAAEHYLNYGWKEGRPLRP